MYAKLDNLHTAIHGAWALLQADGVKAQLVGTAALVTLGYDVTASDVDFLCETMPLSGIPLSGHHYFDGAGSRETWIDGVEVNFIMVTDTLAPFLAPDPIILDGIPVAPVEYVLRLKARADRTKDKDFFAANSKLAAIIGWQDTRIVLTPASDALIPY